MDAEEYLPLYRRSSYSDGESSPWPRPERNPIQCTEQSVQIIQDDELPRHESLPFDRFSLEILIEQDLVLK